jgi:hypothetical protein
MAKKKVKEKKLKGPVKFDSQKIRLELIPPLPMLEVGKVYTSGSEKYDDWNWDQEPGFNYSRVIGAMERHLNKWKSGIDCDPTNVFNGEAINHLASVTWCALTLMHYQMTGNGTDDRHKRKVKVKP